MKHAVVIGAGFAGLSTAALLARQGWRISVVEKNSGPGGRGGSFEQEGFRFDMGPSWYLMPEVFERFFACFGRRVDDYYTLKRLDPSYQVFFRSRTVQIRSDLEKNVRLFDSLEPGGGDALRAYLAQSAYQYETAMKRFIYKRYERITDFFTFDLLKEAPRLQLFSSLHTLLERRFRSQEARQLLSYNTVFLGADPRSTPALYALMSHVDFNLGVFYPLGGIYEVVRAFERLGREHGVEFHYDAPVESIIVRGGRACGVRTAKGEISGDVVVSGADYHHTETRLLESEQRSYSRRYWESRKLAPSAFILYLGVSGRVRGLEHHNLFLETNWYEHFDTIFKKASWPKRPSYYICAPSKTDPSVAPDGCENLFILVPVAAGLEDTDDVRERLTEQVLTHLEELCGDEFRSRIRFLRSFAHRDFSELYNSFKGTALGLAHTLRQTAIFRPSARSKRLKNLYYSGHYTHPGIGVPMTMIASTLVAQEVGHGNV